MHKSINNLNLIQNLLKEKTNTNKTPKIIAVSKTFSVSNIIYITLKQKTCLGVFRDRVDT